MTISWRGLPLKHQPQVDETHFISGGLLYRTSPGSRAEVVTSLPLSDGESVESLLSRVLLAKQELRQQLLGIQEMSIVEQVKLIRRAPASNEVRDRATRLDAREAEQLVKRRRYESLMDSWE